MPKVLRSTPSETTRPPTPGGSAARLGWVVALTSAAFFMVVLDSTVVITALPRIQQDLRVGLSSLHWTVNAYGIAFAAGIITAAALGDRFGRGRVFSTGLALWVCAGFAQLAARSAVAVATGREKAAVRANAAQASAA